MSDSDRPRDCGYCGLYDWEDGLCSLDGEPCDEDTADCRHDDTRPAHPAQMEIPNV